MWFARVLLITWSGLASELASADVLSPEWSLDWQATPSCSSEAQLRDDVARVLRNAPNGAHKVIARARASQSADGTWQVELVTEIEGESHQRTFEAESCAASESALALILAFAINPAARPAPSEVAAARASSTATDAAPSGTLTPRARPSSPRSGDALHAPAPKPAPAKTDHLLGASTALALDLGTLPRPTEGAELALGLYPGGFRFELSGTSWASREATAAGSSTGATFSMNSATARAGYAWSWGRLALGPALAAQLAQIKASGVPGARAVRVFERSEMSGGVGAGGLLAWRLGDRVELHFLIEGLHWFNRPQFVVTQPNLAPPAVVHQPGGLLVQAALGATVRFF